jgi:hypothetical protein
LIGDGKDRQQARFGWSAAGLSIVDQHLYGYQLVSQRTLSVIDYPLASSYFLEQ